MSRQYDYMGGFPELPIDHPNKIHPPCDRSRSQELDLNLEATELRLGLPGSESRPDEEGSFPLGSFPKNLASGAKRGFSSKATETVGTEKKVQNSSATGQASKAQVVGWPPIRSFRKNTMATTNPPASKTNNNVAQKLDPKQETGGCLYVKVSMDGAPYLRKINLKIYRSYSDLSTALEKMFSCFTIGQYGNHGVAGRLSESRLMDLLRGSEYVLTYEDKDGDWMLVGDVPWNMFTSSCIRLRITKSSEAVGLAKDRSKNEN